MKVEQEMSSNNARSEIQVKENAITNEIGPCGNVDTAIVKDFR